MYEQQRGTYVAKQNNIIIYRKCHFEPQGTQFYVDIQLVEPYLIQM